MTIRATSDALLDSFVTLVDTDLKRTHAIFGVFESSAYISDHQEFDSAVLPASAGEIALTLLDRSNGIEYASDTATKKFIRALLDNKISPAIAVNSKTDTIVQRAFVQALEGSTNQCLYVDGVLKPSKGAIDTIQLTTCLPNDGALGTFETKIDINLALAIYAYGVSKNLLKTADICTSMTLEAIRGETSAFDNRLHELGRPYPGQIATARNIRRIIERSEFTTEDARIAFGGDTGPRCQDAISIRAVPQTHGAVRDAHSWLGEVISDELTRDQRSANPLMSYAIDLLSIALVDLASMSERRTFRLLDSKMSYGLPMNLIGENPGFNHGFPVIQASAAAVLAEMKLKAPKGYGHSRFNQVTGQYTSFELQSCNRLLDLLSLLRKILAIETYMSAQALDLCRQKLTGYSLGIGTQAALSKTREYISTVKENRFASKDMAIAEKIVEYGLLISAVEENVGQLD